MTLPSLQRPAPSGHVTTDPSRRGATPATVSLVCAVLWPLSLALSVASDALLSGVQQVPVQGIVSFVLECCIALAPPVGLVAGGIAAYRAATRPAPRPTRTRAIIALALNVLWLVALLLVTDLGAALVYWATSWGR